MNIEGRHPGYGKVQRHAPRQEPLIRRKQKDFPLEIRTVETTVTRDVYTEPRGDYECLLFNVHVEARVEGQRAYFKHSMKFTRSLTLGDRFERMESDFVRVTRVHAEAMPDFNEIHVKVKAGDTIKVRALWEERPGATGFPYLSLTRVHMCK